MGSTGTDAAGKLQSLADSMNRVVKDHAERARQINESLARDLNTMAGRSSSSRSGTGSGGGDEGQLRFDDSQPKNGPRIQVPKKNSSPPVTTTALQATMGRLSRQVADRWTPALNNAMSQFEINTPQRQAAFLAQVAEESGRLAHVKENLNYSKAGLLKTFPKYFNSSQAAAYARKPERIANRVYANRLGNGDEKSGDGWKYRGRGPIQLTGRDNYREAGTDLGLDLETHPELVEDPAVGAQVAAWFWKKNGLNERADQARTAKDFDRISNVVNRGSPNKPALHQKERREAWERATDALQDQGDTTPP
jgi:putative chitinase